MTDFFKTVDMRHIIDFINDINSLFYFSCIASILQTLLVFSVDPLERIGLR